MKILFKRFIGMAFPYSLIMLFSSCLGINSEVKNKPTDAKLLSATVTSIYNIKLTTLEGKGFDLSTLKGKKILIVNTASKCGYTPQYEELEKLHEKYGSKLAILGFPCNDFGGQESGTADEIATFCKKNYGVTFQMFEKVKIKGPDKCPLYSWLTDPAQNGWNSQAPSWNFCKYLINENGDLMKVFGSGVNPMNKELTDALN
jgi:glutathione peroxidase